MVYILFFWSQNLFYMIVQTLMNNPVNFIKIPSQVAAQSMKEELMPKSSAKHLGHTLCRQNVGRV